MGARALWPTGKETNHVKPGLRSDKATQLKPLYLPGGMENGKTTVGDSLAISHKIKQMLITLPSHFTPRYFFKRNSVSADTCKDEHVHIDVHRRKK